MSKGRMHAVGAGALICCAVAIGAVVAPTSLKASASQGMWGMSPQGEICIETCGPNNLCCDLPGSPPISP